MNAYLRTLLLAICWSGTLQAEPASDPSTALSNASSASFEGSTALLSGIAEGASYTLVALEPLGEGVLAVFEATGASAGMTLELTGEAARTAGRHLGKVVETAASVGGTALLLGGEMIAFVPNQLTRSRHHQRRLTP